MDLGTFVTVDGRPAVRFRRRYDHPAERVWTAITDTGELGHWFPSTVVLQPQAGGTIEFSGDPNTPPSTGTVLEFEPPRRLAYTWGNTELHFEVEPTGESRCVLTLINVLGARDEAARNAAGWSVCLAELDKLLAGGDLDGPHAGAAARSWRGYYDAYVAAGLPSGAGIPSQG